MAPGWLLIWFVGLTLAHLVALAVILRGRSGDREPTSGGADAQQCPACGTVNEPEYRYCRACVSTLGRPSVTGPDDRPGRRRVP